MYVRYLHFIPICSPIVIVPPRESLFIFLSTTSSNRLALSSDKAAILREPAVFLKEEERNAEAPDAAARQHIVALPNFSGAALTTENASNQIRIMKQRRITDRLST
jgi:hypothetical protein